MFDVWEGEVAEPVYGVIGQETDRLNPLELGVRYPVVLQLFKCG